MTILLDHFATDIGLQVYGLLQSVLKICMWLAAYFAVIGFRYAGALVNVAILVFFVSGLSFYYFPRDCLELFGNQTQQLMPRGSNTTAAVIIPIKQKIETYAVVLLLTGVIIANLDGVGVFMSVFFLILFLLSNKIILA